MKLLFVVLITFLIATCLTSCEGYKCGTGTVFDKMTNKPIDSVFCEVQTGVQKMYTDSTGKFDLCNQISGCVPECKDIIISFSKDSYKTVTVENPEGAIIYMER
jgi:hypothetical protein